MVQPRSFGNVAFFREETMQRFDIDGGNAFDFGKTSENYIRSRDIYPQSMYVRLMEYGVGKSGQRVLDLGSGTAILPLNLAHTGAQFTATDISENQINAGKQAARERGLQNICFKVCSAEDTGFPGESFDAVTAVQCFHYFDAQKAAAEIHRLLVPGGLFCKVFMDWLPYEDAVIDEMEHMVLKYNPSWSGGGFREFSYTFPGWAQGRFALVDVQSYNETLAFSKELWLRRILTCRGVGAALPNEKIAEFTEEYRQALEKYDDTLFLKHQIHIEVYNTNT